MELGSRWKKDLSCNTHLPDTSHCYCFSSVVFGIAVLPVKGHGQYFLIRHLPECLKCSGQIEQAHRTNCTVNCLLS